MPGAVTAAYAGAVRDWLSSMQGRVARAVGDDPAIYDLGESDIDGLLDLARAAAHDSGDRTNAPLAAYLVGLARGRHESVAVDELIAAAMDDAATGSA